MSASKNRYGSSNMFSKKAIQLHQIGNVDGNLENFKHTAAAHEVKSPRGGTNNLIKIRAPSGEVFVEHNNDHSLRQGNNVAEDDNRQSAKNNKVKPVAQG
jgi:hypothetical protein